MTQPVSDWPHCCEGKTDTIECRIDTSFEFLCFFWSRCQVSSESLFILIVSDIVTKCCLLGKIIILVSFIALTRAASRCRRLLVQAPNTPKMRCLFPLPRPNSRQHFDGNQNCSIPLQAEA